MKRGLLPGFVLILHYLQANKLACFYFLDVGRRQKLLDLLRAQQTAWTSAYLLWFPWPRSLEDDTWLRWMLCTQWVCITTEKHWAWKSITFLANNEKRCSLSWRQTSPQSSRLFAVNITMRNGQVTPSMMDRSERYPWRAISLNDY